VDAFHDDDRARPVGDRDRPTVDVSHLERFAERCADLADDEIMSRAWRGAADMPMRRDEALSMRGAHAIDVVPDDAGPTPDFE
jgi:hypothetical protein